MTYAGTYNTNRQIQFKVPMLKSIFCDYSNGYILLNAKITGEGDDPAARQTDEKKSRKSI